MRLTPLRRSVYFILVLAGFFWAAAGVGFAQVDDRLWLTTLQPWLCLFAALGSFATALWLRTPNVAVVGGVFAVLASTSRFFISVVDLMLVGEKESVLRVSLWGLILLYSLAFWSGVVVPTAAFLGRFKKGAGNGGQASVRSCEHDDDRGVPAFSSGSCPADVQCPEADLPGC